MQEDRFSELVGTSDPVAATRKARLLKRQALPHAIVMSGLSLTVAWIVLLAYTLISLIY